MTNPQKRKGDAAELEVARLVADLTGYPVRRKLGAGRADDTGDLDGIPLVKKLGRPPMWPPQGKRRPGHGPDTQAPPAIEREDK